MPPVVLFTPMANTGVSRVVLFLAELRLDHLEWISYLCILVLLLITSSVLGAKVMLAGALLPVKGSWFLYI